MISLVMPTYNQGKFIKEAIDSILVQTFTDFELIIVNDSSTDNTEELIKKYDDPRIKYIKKVNGGTGSALNVGFAIAEGEFETWFASDNKMYPNCLEELYNYLQENEEVDHVYGSIDYAYMQPGGLKVDYIKPLTEILDQTWNKEKFYKHYNLGCCWLWRRELRLKCGDGRFQKDPCEDFDMALRMVEAGGNFAFLNKKLGWYRQHTGNISHTLDSHQFYKDVVAKDERRRKPPKEIVIPKKNLNIAIVNLEFDCAGVGWNLKEAINKYTKHKARHITKNTFEFCPDSEFKIDTGNPREFEDLLKWADVVHFNQWIWTHNPLNKNPFLWMPFNDEPFFDLNILKDKRVIFHFHSGEVLAFPNYWVEECKKFNAQILTCDPPSEQIIKGSKWIPNVLDINHFSPVLFDPYDYNQLIKIYSAHGESDDRKNISIYKRFFDQLHRCGVQIPYDIIWGFRKQDSFTKRMKYQVAIESLIEGYIGMVGWEAMAMGQAVIARLSSYTQERYKDLGEDNAPPIQNAESPQEVLRIIRDLCGARPAHFRIMQDSRKWMEDYYKPERIVDMYIKTYKGEDYGITSKVK